jgi:hypothetical protein
MNETRALIADLARQAPGPQLAAALASVNPAVPTKAETLEILKAVERQLCQYHVLLHKAVVRVLLSKGADSTERLLEPSEWGVEQVRKALHRDPWEFGMEQARAVVALDPSKASMEEVRVALGLDPPDAES